MVGPALEGDFSGHKFALGNAEKDVRYLRSYMESAGTPSDIVREVHAFLCTEKDRHGGDILLSELLVPDADEQS
jgi:hypothetical protein